MNKLIYFFIVLLIFFSSNLQNAKETLIYADSINYDKNKDLIARGNVKIISENEILTSDLVIIKDKEKRIIFPTEFQYKDELNNYYYGSSGEFTTDFKDAQINDIKILLNDGSRIVGKEAYKKDKIDLIHKGAFSPCSSKIRIGNFICPVWQMEGEKILHDRKNLFLHQKHSKMRVLNLPIYYLPYIVTPSPLRKKRKSGFLNPTISFNFLDTKTSQTTKFPYYFALDIDKELLFTPVINYGGGVDASQRFIANYDQLISGGSFSIDFSTDTNLENQNNESWIRDASIITNFNTNLNEKFRLSFNSAFQSSPTYLRRTDQNNFLNRKNTLNTTLNLDGYNLKKIDDNLNFQISGYQVVKNNEDNKTTPTALPYVKYSGGTYSNGKTNYNQKISFYNIFRDIATDDHAQQQQKLYHNFSTDTEIYKYNSKINFKTELLSQFYNIENKKISGNDYSGTYERIFPMTGLYLETPLINKKNNLTINPKVSFIFNGSQPSSDKVSNEESTNNSYNLMNNNSLNRYTGTDKLDNSKRMNYGIDINKEPVKFSLSQSYEFDANSNYNVDMGLKDYMSDLLGQLKYDGESNDLTHDFRFNVDQGLIKSQTLSYDNYNKLGSSSIKYTQERLENNSILTTGTETLDISFSSNKFLKYSDVNLSSTFDLIKDDPTKYSFGYKYFDECFGINIDFNRSFFEDRDLKPSDTLTLLFSFKYLGTYRSSNLAVSETEKQDIKWESGSVDNALFN
tara:strand:+ start:2216 stop:4435 length:2220 start_codon:yes stop_codon:yes gene_type:complete